MYGHLAINYEEKSFIVYGLLSSGYVRRLVIES